MSNVRPLYTALPVDDSKEDLAGTLPPTPTKSAWKQIARYALVASLAASGALLWSSRTLQPSSSPTAFTLANYKDPNDLAVCDTGTSRSVTAPKPNIWRNIDVDTAVAVRKWLFDPDRGLNLTRIANSTTTDNTIVYIESWRPPKGHALAFVDGDATRPEKYAHTMISHGGLSPPVIRDYLVGPLPVSAKTSMRPLKEMYTNPDIPNSITLESTPYILTENLPRP